MTRSRKQTLEPCAPDSAGGRGPAKEDPILKILRRSLDRGLRVEIEGLGAFRRAQDGYALEAQNQPQVFVAYAAEDLDLARRLCESLAAAGCSPWLDKDKLLPGQDWPRAIQQAIEISDAFVACFSARSISKRGQFQNELKYALEFARRLPLEAIFLIPVRFDRCAVPPTISDKVHYVDMFPEWECGVRRVLRAIRRASRGKGEPRLCA
jgi:hypothetical protein